MDVQVHLTMKVTVGLEVTISLLLKPTSHPIFSGRVFTKPEACWPGIHYSLTSGALTLLLEEQQADNLYSRDPTVPHTQVDIISKFHVSFAKVK